MKKFIYFIVILIVFHPISNVDISNAKAQNNYTYYFPLVVNNIPLSPLGVHIGYVQDFDYVGARSPIGILIRWDLWQPVNPNMAYGEQRYSKQSVDWLDSNIRKLLDRGIDPSKQLYFRIQNSPEWASILTYDEYHYGGSVWPCAAMKPEYMDEYVDFVEWIVDRYHPYAISVWNEPEVNAIAQVGNAYIPNCYYQHFGGFGNKNYKNTGLNLREQYGTLVKMVYERVAGKTIVIGGEMLWDDGKVCPDNNKDGKPDDCAETGWETTVDFVNTFRKYSEDKYDIFGFHTYVDYDIWGMHGGCDPSEPNCQNPYNIKNNYVKVKADEVRSLGITKPLWVTEGSLKVPAWWCKDHDNDPRTDCILDPKPIGEDDTTYEQMQAAYMDEVVKNLRNWGVEYFYWWGLHDDGWLYCGVDEGGYPPTGDAYLRYFELTSENYLNEIYKK